MVICFCENDDNQFSCTSNSTCETNSYCYSAQQTIYKNENGKSEIKRSAGCLYNSESSLFHCKTRTVDINYRCCKDRDYCNKLDHNLAVASVNNLPAKVNDENDQMWSSYALLIVSFSLVLFSLILFTLYVSKRLKKRQHKNVECDCELNLLTKLLADESRKDEDIKIDTTLPDVTVHIPQSTTATTLGDELEFKKLLGKSEFGFKYLARRQDQNAFVKMLNENLKEEWQNEINIYKIILIRHENILNFIAKGEFFNTKLRSTSYLIVTEYYRLGSLECYLESCPDLNVKQMLKLMLTAASGLNHLHLEISNNQRKPSIVHRNLNSKNFIIKNDLTCVLGNFENAIKSTDLDSLKCFSSTNCRHKTSLLKIVSRPLVYCPPEYLDESINTKSIVSLKSADIYSFGLVLSQVLNFYLTHEYRLPFSIRKQPDEHDPFDCSAVERCDLELRNDEEMKRMSNLLLEQKFTILDDLDEVYSSYCNGMNDDLYRALCLANYLPFGHHRQYIEQESTSLDIPNRRSDAEETIYDADETIYDADKTIYDADETIYHADETIYHADNKKFSHNPTNTQTRSTILELFRIIKESCYLEPLSRLSARKIENDLNLILTKYNEL